MQSQEHTEKVVARNKRAYHDFTIHQKIEAGISLLGTEVKSVKNGGIQLKDGFAFIRNGEAFLRNIHISPYPYGNRMNHDPLRPRKLLLHKNEIKKLGGKIRERGFTLVPLRVYVKKGIIKVELGLVSGKRLHDRREDIKKKDMARDLRSMSGLSGNLK